LFTRVIWVRLVIIYIAYERKPLFLDFFSDLSLNTTNRNLLWWPVAHAAGYQPLFLFFVSVNMVFDL
ncbi:unnamed protein product, partial [Brassica napus]